MAPGAPDAGGAATTSVNQGLDVVRGAAAVLVVAAHARLYPLQTAGVDTAGESTLERLLLLPTSFGKEAVAVFFVLSGYLVGGQALRQVAESRFSWRVYLAKRLSRLWSVLLPGLVVTAVVDALARTAFPEHHALGRRAVSSSVGTALCNAAFLQDSRCATFGTNDALWSLSYEFWFYVVFAAVVVGVVGLARRRWAPGVVGLVVAVSGVALFGPALLLFFPAWLMGAVLAWVLQRERDVPAWFGHRWALGGATSLLLMTLLASTVLRLDDPATFVLVGLGTCPLILLLAWRDPLRGTSRRTVAGAVAWTGTWSFSLYVFHVPVVKLLGLAVASQTALLETRLMVPVVYGIAVGATLLVWPLTLVSERHTATVRDLMLAGLDRVARSRPRLTTAQDRTARRRVRLRLPRERSRTPRSAATRDAGGAEDTDSERAPTD